MAKVCHSFSDLRDITSQSCAKSLRSFRLNNFNAFCGSHAHL